jgi:hypothetical protein
MLDFMLYDEYVSKGALPEMINLANDNLRILREFVRYQDGLNDNGRP